MAARMAAGRILVEAFVVGGVGFALALGLNAISPRGLALGRDYFPPPKREPSATNAPAGTTSSTKPGEGASTTISARLAARGLREVNVAEARRLFEDPGREQERIVFVDARSEEHYQEEHIPGAYLFDRYYPERHLPVVLPACQSAETIVVYCRGGTCEDSEFAAVALVEAGIPAARVGVFTGGILEWTASGLALELGERGSGRRKP